MAIAIRLSETCARKNSLQYKEKYKTKYRKTQYISAPPPPPPVFKYPACRHMQFLILLLLRLYAPPPPVYKPIVLDTGYVPFIA